MRAPTKKRDVAGIARQAASRTLVLAVMLAILLVTTDAWACPMCKAALGSQGRSHGDWVGGFFWSILFMLSMPFLILGGLSAYMYSLVRQARRNGAQSSTPLRAEHGSDVDEPISVS